MSKHKSLINDIHALLTIAWSSIGIASSGGDVGKCDYGSLPASSEAWVLHSYQIG